MPEHIVLEVEAEQCETEVQVTVTNEVQVDNDIELTLTEHIRLIEGEVDDIEKDMEAVLVYEVDDAEDEPVPIKMEEMLLVVVDEVEELLKIILGDVELVVWCK